MPPGQVESVTKWGWSDELQSWTWPGAEGRSLSVRVFSSGDRVELKLNGAIVGMKALTLDEKMRAEFSVPYAAGVLEAVAYRKGVEIARKRLETIGPPVKLRLAAERVQTRNRRHDLSYVAIGERTHP